MTCSVTSTFSGVPGARGERERVDDVQLDDTYSCDCVFIVFYGDNCESSYILYIVLVLLWCITTPLLCSASRRRQKRAQLMKPLDFTPAVSKLHEGNPLFLGDADGDIAMVDVEIRTPRELPRRSIKITSLLGKGAFGEVHRAQFKPPVRKLRQPF